MDDDFHLVDQGPSSARTAAVGGAGEGGGSGLENTGGRPGSGGGSSIVAGTGGSSASSCDDGWMNSGETGMDCGGSCAPCACSGEFGTPELVVTGLGAAGPYYGPQLWRDNQTLFFTRVVDNDENLYQADRSDRGRVFSNPTGLDGINTDSLDGSPFVTPDGLTLYFFSDRDGGPGGRDLWTATRAATSDSFGGATPLPAVNSSAREYFPWLTPDRLGLFFVSDRAGGQGSQDIWLAERGTPAGDFAAPRNVSELNTGSQEIGMTVSRDGLTIIFVSNRSGGAGETDLWLATRATTTSDFSAPVNLGAVNSDTDEDDPKLSDDGQELFFSSTRDGSRHLWRAQRTCATSAASAAQRSNTN